MSSCVSPAFRLCGGTSNVNILESQICVVISKELVYHNGNQMLIAMVLYECDLSQPKWTTVRPL